LAVLKAWNNPLTTEYIIETPAGSKVLKGIAAPQPLRDPQTGRITEYREGGAVHYWFNDVENGWIKSIKGETQ
jgi:hypothetical protein